MKQFLITAIAILMLGSNVNAQAPDPKAYNDIDIWVKDVNAWANHVRINWEIKDEAKARKEAEREERRAKAAERRKNKTKGKRGYFVHKGVKYDSVKDFQKSEAYAKVLAAAKERAASIHRKQRIEEFRRQQAKEFLANRRLYNRPMIFLQEEARQKALYERAMKKVR